MTVTVDTGPITVEVTEGVTVGGLQAERDARIAGDAATLADAAADATTKANAAQAAAAADATTKANAAQTAASAHADAGDAATLASASTDATSKANAAQAAAAIDATSKANAAQAAANVHADTGDAILAATAGTTVGTATVNSDGTITPTFTTVWGIDSNGDPYYNAAGASSGEEAVLVVGVDGSLNIVKPGG